MKTISEFEVTLFISPILWEFGAWDRFKKRPGHQGPNPNNKILNIGVDCW